MTDICSGRAVIVEQNASSQLHAGWILFTNVSTPMVNYWLLNAAYLALELVWWSLATRCVQWGIHIFVVSSRWSCSSAQTNSRVDECVLPRIQAGSSGVAIWGAFHSRRKSEIHVRDGNIDQYQYIRVLKTKMLPFARRDFHTMVQYTERDASWISSKMRMCSRWIGFLCHRIWT